MNLLRIEVVLASEEHGSNEALLRPMRYHRLAIVRELTVRRADAARHHRRVHVFGGEVPGHLHQAELRVRLGYGFAARRARHVTALEQQTHLKVVGSLELVQTLERADGVKLVRIFVFVSVLEPTAQSPVARERDAFLSCQFDEVVIVAENRRDEVLRRFEFRREFHLFVFDLAWLDGKFADQQFAAAMHLYVSVYLGLDGRVDARPRGAQRRDV